MMDWMFLKVFVLKKFAHSNELISGFIGKPSISLKWETIIIDEWVRAVLFKS